ncbi:methyltransferase domain-containing protein [Agromyces sp. SYSU T00194]|uniref:methyltransferase domain-containing protein n=1 Tax=Agromyces chitinivorans TaxID=3158560 RepID=UPI0033946098
MTGRPLVDLLRCPICVGAFGGDVRGTIRCGNGHAYDANRRGYLTLFPAKRPKVRGDTAEMLAARDRVLETPPFRSLRDAVAEAAAADAPEGAVLVDLGCGTGQYATTALERIAVPSTALLADLSPDAVRTAVRRTRDGAPATEVLGVVLDLWSPLPVATSGVDRVLNVFAPRNLPEFARVLAPGGRLVTVIPSDHHLSELRAAGAVIDVRGGKREAVLADAAAAGLRLLDASRFDGALDGGDPAVVDLVAMGPSAHHASAGTDPVVGRVTVSVDVLVFASGD